MMPVDVCPRDRGSQWVWLEMGQCYSKKSVVPESDTSERSSMTSGSLESDTQQENKVSLSVSEGTKSKLLEQVSRLEEKLEAVDHKEASGGPYEKMVLVKDQCIQKLQAEVKASQEQLIAQKLKHEKKVKKLQTDLATAKQEAAITVLELNEKIKTLYEGKPAPREDSLLEGFCGGLPPVEEGDRKISLIMELLTQVSLQTERITQLKEVLEEKERKIQQLEAERSLHPPQEVKDPPGCLPEAPVFSTHDIPPVVSDENL
ncbi:coiled-coil domain-containing protein 192 isoform X2 [Gorilla gorilla gorilla]|uniref:coiled-coil domain-containing protein 192 isoform X2 n=1 Tax=Gorilla gorilla gorilla TaxID=9595 RepID=UPI0030083648